MSSVRSHFSKSRKTESENKLAIVGLAEWIIDDTCLVWFSFSFHKWPWFTPTQGFQSLILSHSIAVGLFTCSLCFATLIFSLFLRELPFSAKSWKFATFRKVNLDDGRCLTSTASSLFLKHFNWQSSFSPLNYRAIHDYPYILNLHSIKN